MPLKISEFRDVVYSPDDEAETGKGWYIHDYETNKTSQLFATKNEAWDASLNNKLVFE